MASGQQARTGWGAKPLTHVVQPSNAQRLASETQAPEKPKPLRLHAPDAPGQAAHKASQFASVLSFNLLAGASPTIDTTKRLEALERVFTVWPALCREMKALELAAPRCSASGLEQAARLADFADAHPPKTPQAARAGSREGQR